MSCGSNTCTIPPQAIGDGGQGWGNVLLYVLASDKIRQRLYKRLTGQPDKPHYVIPKEPRQPRKEKQPSSGDAHVDIAPNSPLVVNVNRQSVSYHSVHTHEPTTPTCIN